MTRKLLVTSVGSGIGHAILAALRRVHAPWHVIGVNSAAFNAGVFDCDSAWLAPPTAQREAFEARLLEVVEAERPAMILPGRDDDLPVLAAMRDRLAELGAFVLVGSAEGVDICNDKYRTAKVLRAAGLPFTETAVNSDEIGVLLASCGFPLLAKPRCGYGSRRVRVLFDRNDIEAVLVSGSAMIVQEYLVPGNWKKARGDVTPVDVERDGVLRQEDELLVHVFLGRDGKALGVNATRNSFVHGASHTVDVLDDPLLEAVAREGAELLGRHGLIGPCSFSGRRLADGSWRFYEVNARCTGASGVRAAFGFNEVEAAWRHFVDGEEAPACLTFDKDLAAFRYLTENVIRKGDLERLRRSGRWRASTRRRRHIIRARGGSNDMTRKLLITSVGSGVGHAILAALRRVHAPWHVIGVNSAAFNAGVFDCDSAWLVPPTAEREDFEARLLEVVETERPALILPGRDDDLTVLAAMRARLAELGAFVLVGSAEAVAICNDKYRTAKVLRAAGLPFTETAASRDEIEALLASCSFPLFAKPRRGYGARGVRVLFDRDDLEAALACGTEMVVQEYLVPRSWNKARAEISRADVERDGILRQEGELSAEVLLGRDGKALGVIAWCADKVYNDAPAVEVLDDPLLEAVAREGAELLGWHGLIGPCNIAGRRLTNGSWGFSRSTPASPGPLEYARRSASTRSKPPGVTLSRERKALTA